MNPQIKVSKRLGTNIYIDKSEKQSLDSNGIGVNCTVRW